MTVWTTTSRLGRFAARAAAGFCVAFAAFQVALALGAPYGDIAWGGSTTVLSGSMRFASLAASAYLLAAAAAMLVRSQDWGRRWPQTPFWWFNVFLTLQLALNTAANLAAQSSTERFGMGAASAIGCLLCAVALLAPRVSQSETEV